MVVVTNGEFAKMAADVNWVFYEINACYFLFNCFPVVLRFKFLTFFIVINQTTGYAALDLAGTDAFWIIEA